MKEIIIESDLLRLEVVSMKYAEALFEIGKAESIWRFLPGEPFKTLGCAEKAITKALSEYEKGLRYPFFVIDKIENRLVGTTSLGNLRLEHGGVEVGWTWYGETFQKTHFNTLTKYELLKHCFEEMDLMRVELKTDARNLNSQRAIERLGAKKEGVFRKHMLLDDGYVRDSVYYSIIDSEWPMVKSRLAAKLAGYGLY